MLYRHFGDVLSSQSIGLVLKNWNKQQKQHSSTTKYTTTDRTEKTKAMFGRLPRP